jgi:hypothetical protein
MDAYAVLNQLISDRMAEPVDDVMSDIIRLELDGRALTQDELFRIAHLLFVGGSTPWPRRCRSRSGTSPRAPTPRLRRVARPHPRLPRRRRSRLLCRDSDGRHDAAAQWVVTAAVVIRGPAHRYRGAQPTEG